MTQPTPLSGDRQHASPTQPEAQPQRSGWWIALLALLPIACCGLPLLLVAGVTAGSGAALGGIAGAVLMLAGAAAFAIWAVRRRTRAARQAGTSTSVGPDRDRCC